MNLQDEHVEFLYRGLEGVVTHNLDTGRIAFCLNLGSDVEMGAINADGILSSFEGDSLALSNGIWISKSEVKVWTAEEAEPYKAFLRSKGITLPHVMS